MARAKQVEMTPEQKAAKVAENKAAKAANFVKLAEARVNKAMDAIAVIGNLASPNYVYEAEQVEVIKQALLSEVETMVSRFAPKGEQKAKGFSLATPAPAATEQPAPAE